MWFWCVPGGDLGGILDDFWWFGCVFWVYFLMFWESKSFGKMLSWQLVCNTASRKNLSTNIVRDKLFAKIYLRQIVWKKLNRLKNVSWDKSFETWCLGQIVCKTLGHIWCNTLSGINRLENVVWDKSFEIRCLGQIFWKTLYGTNRLNKRCLGQIVCTNVRFQDGLEYFFQLFEEEEDMIRATKDISIDR